MNRRDFLAGLSSLCAVTASGLQLKSAAAADELLSLVAKSAKVRHVFAYDMGRYMHRFDILIGPDGRFTERTQQFGVDIRSRGRVPTQAEIEPALKVLADHVEKVTGQTYEFTPGPMRSADYDTNMQEYRV